jgi:predicted membrane channel-forming protein YqfA (hemolysin III family)
MLLGLLIIGPSMPPLLTLKVGRGAGYVMSGVLRVLARIAVFTIIFALATYTALTIQTYIGDSPTFNQTLGLGSQQPT